MGRRVFLSILGAGFYQKCRYQKDDFIGRETTFVQEDIVQYLKEKESWGHDGDQIIMLLTDKAEKYNWDASISSRSLKDQESVSYVGLEKCLMDMGVSYQTVRIDDGKNTEEMWKIFEVIFKELQEGDRLYFDITNSFRYLPMLLLVLVNYAKLLKNVSVEAIFYGNYEARNKETNIAPIMDLLPLSSLQDWTSAASDYLRYGQVEKLHELSETELAPILRNPSTRTTDTATLRKFVNTLKKAVDERITCRGLEIVKSANVNYLKKTANEIQNITIVQLRPIFDKIKDSLSDFDAKHNVQNSLKAAKWCFENKLYQQATTLLEEGLITVLCTHYDLKYENKDDRDIISCCIHIATNDAPEEEWRVKEEDIEKVKGILSDEHVWKNKVLLDSLCDIIKLRNDYNHAGFKESHMGAKTIIEKVTFLMNEAEQFLSSFQ